MAGRASIVYRLRGLYTLTPFCNSAPDRLIPSGHPIGCGVVKPLDIAPAFTAINTYVLYT